MLAHHRSPFGRSYRYNIDRKRLLDLDYQEAVNHEVNDHIGILNVPRRREIDAFRVFPVGNSKERGRIARG